MFISLYDELTMTMRNHNHFYSYNVDACALNRYFSRLINDFKLRRDRRSTSPPPVIQVTVDLVQELFETVLARWEKNKSMH